MTATKTIALLACLCAVATQRVAAAPSLGPISLSSRTVPRFAKLEATFTAEGDWQNPFDPHQVAIDATIKLPSGRSVVVPCFLYRPYRRELVGGAERLVPTGPDVWKLRFAPWALGRHQLMIAVKTPAGSARSRWLSFACTPSRHEGFVRRSKRVPTALVLDSGRPFIAIGEDVCWPGRRGTYDYDDWYNSLARAGGNWSRVWQTPFAFSSIELFEPGRSDAGMGRYRLDAAWRLDYITQLAERLGIRQMLCIDSFNIIRRSNPYPAWESNPYAAEHGGPVAQPRDYFTNPEAKRMYRNRLRYLVARYGYSTSVFAWEFWNEIDVGEQYDSAVAAAWHREMARYLRSIDPYRHLITTSYGRTEGDPAVDALPEMDLVQSHAYGRTDFAQTIADTTALKLKRYRKPHIFGEFGVGYAAENSIGKNPRDADPTGIALHNGLWAGILSGGAGTAMSWYWDDYVHPLSLYRHFAGLATVLKVLGVANTLHPVPVSPPLYAESRQRKYGDLWLQGQVVSWERVPSNAPQTVTVAPDGTISQSTPLSGLLHGVGGHRDKHNPVTFVVNYPTQGEFGVMVGGVSGWGGAALQVRVDGNVALTKELADPDGTADTTTIHRYDGSYSVSVPAGLHRIVVENTGPDWCMVSYRLTNAFVRRGPDVRVMAASCGPKRLVWVQNRHHTWYEVAVDDPPKPEPAGLAKLPVQRNGQYAVRWMDPYSGRTVSTTTALARGGLLPLSIPPVATDVAAVIAPASRGGG